MRFLKIRAFLPLQVALLAAIACGSIGMAKADPFDRKVKAVLSRIHDPVFPKRDFVITKYGASSDSADCTEAIRKAIEDCHRSGGGRVVVPEGVFVTGAVHLKSKVNLHLSEGATLKFDPDPEKYPMVLTRWEGVECMNYSPLIYSYEQNNVAVTGKGTLDGSATTKNWLSWKGSKPFKQDPARDRLFEMGEKGVPVEERVFGEGSFLRPSFIQFYQGDRVMIEGVTIKRSPFWVIHPVLCTNVTVRGVTVESKGRNNDGCDPESCKDVLIEDCTFITGDDCIAIKSGRNNDGRRIGVPSENFVIRNCRMADGHGGVTIGSEISGGCRNVYVENIKLDSPHLNQAIRFKNNAARGGVIEDVHIRNIEIGRVRVAAVSIEYSYEEGKWGDHIPELRDLTIEKLTTESCGRAIYASAVSTSEIDNVKLVDCTFNGAEKGNRIPPNIELELENVRVNRKGGD